MYLTDLIKVVVVVLIIAVVVLAGCGLKSLTSGGQVIFSDKAFGEKVEIKVTGMDGDDVQRMRQKIRDEINRLQKLDEALESLSSGR